MHNTVTVAPGDSAGLERLARYLLRAPVSLERLEVDDEARVARYAPRPGRARPPGAGNDEAHDAHELLARVLMHIPEARRHLVRYYGAYSSVVRARSRGAALEHGVGTPRVNDASRGDEGRGETGLGDPDRRALRRLWAALIRRIYETDPLVCPRCGQPIRIVAFITEPRVIATILRHLEARSTPGRGPPPEVSGSEAA